MIIIPEFRQVKYPGSDWILHLDSTANEKNAISRLAIISLLTVPLRHHIFALWTTAFAVDPNNALKTTFTMTSNHAQLFLIFGNTNNFNF